jgi:hypothetical protein
VEIEKARRISADPVKGGMPKRDLSGISSQEIPALTQADPDEDHNHHMENIRISLEKRNQSEQDQYDPREEIS